MIWVLGILVFLFCLFGFVDIFLMIWFESMLTRRVFFLYSLCFVCSLLCCFSVNWLGMQKKLTLQCECFGDSFQQCIYCYVFGGLLSICFSSILISVSSYVALCCKFVALTHMVTLHVLVFWFGLLGVLVICWLTILCCCCVCVCVFGQWCSTHNIICNYHTPRNHYVHMFYSGAFYLM